MTQQTRSTLKGVFEQGDVPQGSDYADLIDSYANLVVATAQSFASEIFTPELVATKVSADVVVASAMRATATVSAVSMFTDSISVSGASTFTGIVSAGTINIKTELQLGVPTTTAVVSASAQAGYIKVIIAGSTAKIAYYV